MPMVKSSSITPISDAAPIRAGSSMMPSADGPASTPANRNPMMGTSPSRNDAKAVAPATSSSRVSCPMKAGGPLA